MLGSSQILNFHLLVIPQNIVRQLYKFIEYQMHNNLLHCKVLMQYEIKSLENVIFGIMMVLMASKAVLQIALMIACLINIYICY